MSRKPSSESEMAKWIEAQKINYELRRMEMDNAELRQKWEEFVTENRHLMPDYYQQMIVTKVFFHQLEKDGKVDDYLQTLYGSLGEFYGNLSEEYEAEKRSLERRRHLIAVQKRSSEKKSQIKEK